MGALGNVDFRNPDHLLKTKAELIESIEVFIEGDADGNDYVAVFFELPGLEDYEVIVNPGANVKTKLDYYVSMYNDDLQLNVNNNVKIVGISFL